MPGNAFCPSGSQAELSSQGQLTGTVLWEGCSPSQRDPDLNSSSFVTAADPLVMAWSTQRFLASRAHCRSVCLGPCRANACAYMPCSLVPQFWEALCMHFIVSQEFLYDSLLPCHTLPAPDFLEPTPKLPTCTQVCLRLCFEGSPN